MNGQKALSNEELEKVNGGYSFQLNGSNLEILLEPNESAVEKLSAQMRQGISVFGRKLVIMDSDGALMAKAAELDAPQVIGLSRKVIVMFRIENYSRVIVTSVQTLY